MVIQQDEFTVNDFSVFFFFYRTCTAVAEKGVCCWFESKSEHNPLYYQNYCIVESSVWMLVIYIKSMFIFMFRYYY